VPNNNNALKSTISFLSKIENRLGKVVSEKKEEIEKRLEEIIKQETEKARIEVERIEKKFEEEQGALINYQSTIAELESSRSALNKRLKDHLNKAIRLRTQIESLTETALQEFTEMKETALAIEELDKKAEEKASSLQKDLEEKFGIEVDIPRALDAGKLDIDIDKEIEELLLIKERIASGELPQLKEEEPEEEKKEEDKDAEEIEKAPEEEKPPAEVEDLSDEEESKQPETGEDQEEEAEEETPSEEQEEIKPSPDKNNAQQALETLAKLRKSETTKDNVEIYYYQSNDKKILDNEHLMSAFDIHLEEVKRLFEELSLIKSLKEQFFVKRQIITHQENLYKIVDKNIEMLKGESWTFPQFTSDIVNMDVLSDISKKLTLLNWSNYLDFISFSDFVNELKNNFQDRTTPPSDYLSSILKELEA